MKPDVFPMSGGKIGEEIHMFGSFIVSALPATSLGYFVGISLTQEISASGKPTMHQAWAKKKFFVDAGS